MNRIPAFVAENGLTKDDNAFLRSLCPDVVCYVLELEPLNKKRDPIAAILERVLQRGDSAQNVVIEPDAAIPQKKTRFL